MSDRDVLLDIADRIERWARLDDCAPPGLDEVEKLRQVAAAPATATYAFADALLALEEIDRKDIADRLRERWFDVPLDGGEPGFVPYAIEPQPFVAGGTTEGHASAFVPFAADLAQEQLPRLRAPTRMERLAFRVRGRWPESYVNARLTHWDELQAALSRMEPHEAMRALLDQSPYDDGGAVAR